MKELYFIIPLLIIFLCIIAIYCQIKSKKTPIIIVIILSVFVAIEATKPFITHFNNGIILLGIFFSVWITIFPVFTGMKIFQSFGKYEKIASKTYIIFPIISIVLSLFLMYLDLATL